MVLTTLTRLPVGLGYSKPRGRGSGPSWWVGPQGSQKEACSSTSRLPLAAWRGGEVIGCLLEVSEDRLATMSFALNGRPLGPAFESVAVDAAGLCPPSA